MNFYTFYIKENYNLPSNFIPKVGSCMIAAEILVKKLLKQRTDFDVIEGYITFPNVDWENNHTWIEFNNGEILDPTKSQWGLEDIQYLKSKQKRYKPQDYLKLCKKYPIKNRKDYFSNGHL